MDFTTYPVKASSAQMRVGDAERQDAAVQLQSHFAAGRITWDELDERLGQAYAARTESDLKTLFTDLPRTKPQIQQSVPRWEMPVPRTLVQRAMVLYLVMAVVLVSVVTQTLYAFVVLWWFGAIAFGTLRHGPGSGHRPGHRHGPGRGHHHGRHGHAPGARS